VLLGGAALALFLVAKFVLFPLLDRLPEGSVEEKELALQCERSLVATSESQAASLSAAQERLKSVEAGLLESPSPSLANAEWQRLVRDLAESKAVEVASTESLRVQELGPEYTLVTGQVKLRCRLDQLVDFMAALATAPRLLSVTTLRIAPIPGEPQKRMNVEMTVGAAMRGVKGTPGGNAAAVPK